MTFDNVAKRFGDFYAVKDFSLKIEDREILGLLGPNGAGKTTLMLVLGTVYRPTSGTAYVNGHNVVDEANNVRKMIGISFQDPRVDGILSTFEVLNWHGKMTTNLTQSQRRKKVEEVIEQLDLKDGRDKRTWLLSGGMRKKVENAKVFVQRPPVAVFDEPTAFLDVPSRLKVWGMIQQLREEGSTVIVATNMMDEAERLSHKIAIMNQGKLVSHGTSRDLKARIEGGEVLEITVEGPREYDKETITQFKEVHHVVDEEKRILVYLNQGRLLLPKIVEVLTSQGLRIESVHLKEVTLEDVFLASTGHRL